MYFTPFGICSLLPIGKATFMPRPQYRLNAISCSNRSLQPWQLGRIPSTTDGFDEQDAGVELPAADIDVILFVAKSTRLRRHNLKIGIYAPGVAVHKYTKGFF